MIKKNKSNSKALIDSLLSKLNFLENEYGKVQVQKDSNYDPSGEVNAKIEEIKIELEKLGIELLWNDDKYTIQQKEPRK